MYIFKSLFVFTDGQDHDSEDGESICLTLARKSKKEEFALRDKLIELFTFSNTRIFDALIKSTKLSLEMIRKRIYLP